MSLVYRFYEVTVIKRNHGVHFGFYIENSQWDIVSTNVFSELIPLGVEMQIHFIFNLKRKSQYVTVNVLRTTDSVPEPFEHASVPAGSRIR